MVTRSYKAPDFGVQDQRTAPQGQVGGAGQATGAAIEVGDSGWRDNMLAQFAKMGASHLDKMADVAYSNLVLEGQAAAGVIESEEELQGNPLTRDWKLAGYRDTMGKLALADSDAQFSADIKNLREGNSDDLQTYLSKRRDKLMPGIAGMSREARASATGQLLLQDRAATQTWASEHTKFIIEQKQQAIAAQHSVALRTFGATQAMYRIGDTSEKDFSARLQSTAGTMVGAVWMDSSLPDDVKTNATFEMLQMTLSNDSTELYDYLAQNEVPDGKGGSSTLLSRLGMKQQQQLANTYRDAHTRTSDQRNLYQMANIASIEAQLDNNAYKGTYEDLDEILAPQVMRRVITGEKRTAILNKFMDAQYKRDASAPLVQMALRGDTDGIFKSGATQKDVMDAVDASLIASGASAPQRLQTYLQMGLAGTPGGFARTGEVLGPALRQMRSKDGTVLPQHLDTWKSINTTVRTAEARGNMSAREQVLSGMSEDDRMFASRVFALTDDGKPAEAAVAAAADAEAREAAMTPSMRAARAQGVSTEVSKAIDAIEPRNLLQTGWLHLKSIVSDEAAADVAIRPRTTTSWRDGIFSNTPTVELYAKDARQALEDESRRVLLVNPTARAEDVILTAKTNVAARTIQTRHGQIILPHRADAAQIFGVGQANLAKVGPAIDKILTETKADAKWHVQFTHRGVFAQEYDRSGAPVGTGSYLDPKNVRTAVEELMKDERTTAGLRYGVGKEVKVGGVKLRYNGDNTAGVSAEDMLKLRDNLVESEGVTAEVKKDLSGRKDKAGRDIVTTGVGVSSHNPNAPKPGPDGKVSEADIRISFLGASSEAAAAGRRVVTSLGLEGNQPAFLLLSELAYQSGPAFSTAKNPKTMQPTNTARAYQSFLAELKPGNTAKAQEAFKKTAAWYYSVDPKKRGESNMDLTKRRKHYLKLIEQSTQGE